MIETKISSQYFEPNQINFSYLSTYEIKVTEPHPRKLASYMYIVKFTETPTFENVSPHSEF